MDNFKIGRVVISKHGRDKGRYMAIILIDNKRVLVVDGKERKIEKPKPKNTKHLQLTDMTVSSDLLTKNNALRKHLNKLNREDKNSCQNPI